MTDANDVILLTGATGFLGTELAAGLMRRPETERIYALVRAADQQEAAHRLRAAWHHEPALYEAVGGRIIPLTGDFTKSGLGLDDRMEQKVKETVSLVIHAGAEIRFPALSPHKDNVGYPHRIIILIFFETPLR